MPLYRVHMMCPLYRDFLVRADNEEEAQEYALRGEGVIENDYEGRERVTDIEVEED